MLYILALLIAFYRTQDDYIPDSPATDAGCAINCIKPLIFCVSTVFSGNQPSYNVFVGYNNTSDRVYQFEGTGSGIDTDNPSGIVPSDEFESFLPGVHYMFLLLNTSSIRIVIDDNEVLWDRMDERNQLPEFSCRAKLSGACRPPGFGNLVDACQDGSFCDLASCDEYNICQVRIRCDECEEETATCGVSAGNPETSESTDSSLYLLVFFVPLGFILVVFFIVALLRRRSSCQV